MFVLNKIRGRSCQIAAVVLLLGSSVNAGWASDVEMLKPCTRRSTRQESLSDHPADRSRTSSATKYQTKKYQPIAAGFCPLRFTQDFLLDQKAIWTSPLHLHTQDKSWLAPLAVGTLGLLASDQDIMRHFGSSPLAHSNSFSNYGLATLAAGAASLYLGGLKGKDRKNNNDDKKDKDDHSRETGLLAGEAALNAVVVAETMKLAFERPRPNAANAGSFGAGGTSFPSEHALAAWSIASVIAHEYPGPLTKLLAYGTATGISDAADVGKAILTGSLAFFLIERYGLGLKVFPLSIYALEALLTFTFLTGVRVLSRMLAESLRRDSASKRLLLVGAGHAAQMIIREIQEVETGYRVIGCVDDNPLKKGTAGSGRARARPGRGAGEAGRQTKNRRNPDCHSIGHPNPDVPFRRPVQRDERCLPHRPRNGGIDRGASHPAADSRSFTYGSAGAHPGRPRSGIGRRTYPGPRDHGDRRGGIDRLRTVPANRDVQAEAAFVSRPE